MATAALALPEDDQDVGPVLTPLVPPDGWVPGKYASFDVSPEDMYGPDELGEYKSAIDDLSETCTRADSSARLWEVMEAWQARLFARGHHFLTASRQGWGLAGATRSASTEVFQKHDSGKMFPVNVYGARQDKIVSALSRDVPAQTFVPKRDKDPMDQTAADEAKKYLAVWKNDTGDKELVGRIADLFYTDDRVVLYTRSVADEQAWGTETIDEQQETFDAPVDAGVTPETEGQPESGSPDVPAVREITTAFGKLENKVPLYADRMADMPWIRISTEQNENILKERYPWIEDKIKAGGSVGGSDQLDRQARINVRLVVQSSSTSGESWQQDATETLTWYRPSQYRAIKDKEIRNLFRETFPDGLLVVHAAGELAFIRNESMNKHLTILHPKHGSGQNRRAIGTNYLPLQKILNANFNLLDRYNRSAVPRRFALEGPLDVAAMNTQSNDPAKVTPVILSGLPAGSKISDITGIENVPQPTTSIFEFIQWLIQGAPEVMDGAEPTMFGDAETGNDQGVYATAKLKRDAALQVFSMPWRQICIGMAKCAEQAVECAARNRVADIQTDIPGQGRLTVELAKLQGNALCYPESLEIPQTIAEQEAQMAGLLENAGNVQMYGAIVNDPRNLNVFAKFPSMTGLEIPGLDAVEQQQGELELLTQAGPQPNPQFAQMEQQLQMVQQQLQRAEMDPEAQLPEGQQALQQLQQAEQQLSQQMQSTPPQVSSVAVAQDGSENHAIHAAIVLGFLTSAEGRKLKNGDQQQQMVYQNIHLHWSEHVEMSQKLTPPKEIEIKGSVTIDPTKLPPEAQAKAWQAIGLQVAPEELQDDHALVPHEVITEKEGLNEQGVPVKQKIAMSNPNGRLN